MAPSYASADLSYRQAVAALSFACKQLECHLPSDEHTQADISLTIPPYKPVQRGSSVSVCPQCVAELETLEAGDRESYQCTHQIDGGDRRGSGSRRSDDAVESIRKRQPNAGVIRQDLTEIKERYDVFVKALSVLLSVSDDPQEVQSFEDHMLVWAEYIADVRSRAAEVLQILEAPVDNRPIQPAPQAGVSDTNGGTPENSTAATYNTTRLAAAILAGTRQIQNVEDEQVGVTCTC